MEIRVSNLNRTTTENDIRHLFSDYRVMLTSQIKTIADGPKAKVDTYCFISIDNRADAVAAVKKLNGRELLGSSVVLQEGK